MPYKSLAQEGWAHTPAGEKALGGAAKVHEWDQATKGSHLPKHVQSFAQGGPVMSNKGHQSKDETFAKGGAVLGRTTDFMKTPDRFREIRSAKDANKTEDDWGKGSSAANPVGEDKSLKPVKPKG